MKVLNILSRFNVGGTAQWLYQLSKGLTEREIENKLLVGICPQSEIEDSRIKNLNHKIISGLGPNSSPINTVKSFFEIRAEIKTFHPDIVNTHTSKAGVIGRLAAATIRPTPKIVHTYHGHVFVGYFNPLIEFLIKTVERILSLITDLYLVLGRKVFADLVNAKILRDNNHFEILPGVEDFSKMEKSKARHELQIPVNSFVVGWLGRKVPIKRLDRIIDLAKMNPDLVFLIAGVGTDIKITFAEKFENQVISNIVEIDYATPNLIWSASDVCIIASDNEGIPTSAIEAALFSLPVVSTEAGSIRDVVEDGVTGYVCKSDLDSLSTAIRTLRNNSSLTLEMGKKAREVALAKFSPAAFTNAHINGYKLALQK